MPTPRGKPVAQAGSIPWSLPRILRSGLERSRAQVPEGPRYIKTGHPRTNPLATVPESPELTHKVSFQFGVILTLFLLCYLCIMVSISFPTPGISVFFHWFLSSPQANKSTVDFCCSANMPSVGQNLACRRTEGELQRTQGVYQWLVAGSGRRSS